MSNKCKYTVFLVSKLAKATRENQGSAKLLQCFLYYRHPVTLSTSVTGRQNACLPSLYFKKYKTVVTTIVR